MEQSMSKAHKKIKDALWPLIDQIYVMVYNFLDGIYASIYIRVCKIQNNKIVFDSYQGKELGDNPKYIAEEILKQGLNWEMVWLQKDINAPLPEGIRAVWYGSGKATRERASAKVWIENTRSSIRPPKKESQILIQTWHGGLNFKNVEGAAEDKLSEEYVRLAKQDGHDCDAIISGCGLRSQEYKKYFWLNEKTEILEYGLPRNDALLNEDVVCQKREQVRRMLGIPMEKKVVLYMPTFREDRTSRAYIKDYSAVLDAFEHRFGESFVFLVRMHPNVEREADNILYSDKVFDGTHYSDAQELYMASDYMISDYSSSVFDFSLLRRPVFLYTEDLDAYREERGLNENFDMAPFSRAGSIQELCTLIEAFSEAEYWDRFAVFEKIWQPFDDGHAAERTVNWLKEKMKK